MASRFTVGRRAALTGAALAPFAATATIVRAAGPDLSALHDTATGKVPIGADERRRRLDRA